MRPIVDGLEESFAEQVAFQFLNAEDGAVGETAFKRLSLPGHPSYVILRPDGSESFRTFGVVVAQVLEEAIRTAQGS